MHKIAIIGLDIAKDVFQVHAVDKRGAVVSKRKLARRELEPYFRRLSPCLVGIEACAAAHHWGRVLAALGHRVKLMPPTLVKPYVKSQKNDAADAEAICEAVQRPNMRFVPVKSREQRDLTRGPGRPAAALDIDGRLDGIDLCRIGPLRLARDDHRAPEIGVSTRIRLSRETGRRLRFYVRGNPFVSGPNKLNR